MHSNNERRPVQRAAERKEKMIIDNSHAYQGKWIVSDEDVIISLDDDLRVEGIECQGDIIASHGVCAKSDIRAKGRIEISGPIETGGSIKAGWHIDTNGGIQAGGDVEAGECIRSKRWIIADGGIKAGRGIAAEGKISAGNDIRTGGYLKAGVDISSGGCIDVAEGIQSAGGIIAKTYISAQKRIFAGISPEQDSTDCIRWVKCAELRCGEIAYGQLMPAKEVKQTLPLPHGLEEKQEARKEGRIWKQLKKCLKHMRYTSR